jgi:hypothetical protein
MIMWKRPRSMHELRDIPSNNLLSHRVLKRSP